MIQLIQILSVELLIFLALYTYFGGFRRPSFYGPKNCKCHAGTCASPIKPGYPGCEYYNHHCNFCHKKGFCTALKCKMNGQKNIEIHISNLKIRKFVQEIHDFIATVITNYLQSIKDKD